MSAQEDFAKLRTHVPARPAHTKPVLLPRERDARISVMGWLQSIGQMIARKVTTVPGSPLARLYPRR